MRKQDIRPGKLYAYRTYPVFSHETDAPEPVAFMANGDPMQYLAQKTPRGSSTPFQEAPRGAKVSDALGIGYPVVIITRSYFGKDSLDLPTQEEIAAATNITYGQFVRAPADRIPNTRLRLDVITDLRNVPTTWADLMDEEGERLIGQASDGAEMQRARAEANRQDQAVIGGLGRHGVTARHSSSTSSKRWYEITGDDAEALIKLLDEARVQA